MPLLICLLVCYRGLFCWFQQDDFSWLRMEMHSVADFRRLLLEPFAQGTIRPLSERFFFLLFRKLFDLHAFPYRLFVFLTQFANLLLLTAILRRLTGSRPAAATGALVWAVNIALLYPLAWTSTYNQILCSFFYLAALLLFLRHVETGRWSFYFWQGGAFLLGFGALEIIVAYPFVLLVYCLLLARRHAWKALPLLIPSALYTVLHLWFIPRATTGPYALHFTGSMFRTLWNYWTWALGPVRFSKVFPIRESTALALVLLLTVILFLALLLSEGLRRRTGLFGLAWFLLTLGPVLPLRDHTNDYYLTIPAIGLAVAAASALPSLPRLVGLLWLLVYFGCSVPVLERGLDFLYERGQAAHRLIESVREARARRPGKTILLTGVSDYLFYAVIYDEGLRTAGLSGVYLAPDNEGIAPRPGLLPVDHFELPARATLAALRAGSAVVCDVSSGRLLDITNAYAASAPARLKAAPPRRVNVGDLYMADQLGSGWSGFEGTHRWMGRRAQVRLAGPRSPEDRLRIQAIHSEQPQAGPVHLSVSVDGIPIGRVEIRNNRTGEHIFPLPPSLIGKQEITVTLETDRTFRIPGDERDLGLAFGVVELI
ncbi:MAG: glycosyltransferase family 39 protein [Acidobacteria bacterium]|nr:glycosyltransferase family 39 protein [Acidobacteriota bacterium]